MLLVRSALLKPSLLGLAFLTLAVNALASSQPRIEWSDVPRPARDRACSTFPGCSRERTHSPVVVRLNGFGMMEALYTALEDTALIPRIPGLTRAGLLGRRSVRVGSFCECDDSGIVVRVGHEVRRLDERRTSIRRSCRRDSTSERMARQPGEVAPREHTAGSRGIVA